MADFDTTSVRPILLGAPTIASDQGNAWVFGATKLDPAYTTTNVQSRFLRQSAVFRKLDTTAYLLRLAFGWVNDVAPQITPAHGAIALCSTTFPRSSNIRIRRTNSARTWIEQPCATLSSSAIGTVDATNAARANLTGTMTLGCWIYPTTIDTNARRIVTWRSSGATRWPFEISIIKTGTNPKLRFAYTHSSGTSATADSSESASLALNTWAHVAVTISGTALAFYVNGSAAGTATLAASTRDAGNGSLQFGASSTDGFAGRVFDWKLYSTAFSSDDATLIGRIESAVTSTWASLVAWVPFAEPRHLSGTSHISYGAASADLAAGDAAAMQVSWAAQPGDGSGLFLHPTATIVEIVAETALFDQATLTAEQFDVRNRDGYAIFAEAGGTKGPVFSLQVDVSLETAVSPYGEAEHEIGRLICGTGHQFSANVTADWKISVEDPSIIDTADFGQLWYETRSTYRGQTLTFDMVPELEAMQLLEILRAKGVTGELFYIADPSSLTYGLQQSMLLRLAGRAEITSQAFDLWTLSIPVEEIREG